MRFKLAIGLTIWDSHFPFKSMDGHSCPRVFCSIIFFSLFVAVSKPPILLSLSPKSYYIDCLISFWSFFIVRFLGFGTWKPTSSGIFTTNDCQALWWEPLSSTVLIIVSWVSMSELFVDLITLFNPFRLLELLLRYNFFLSMSVGKFQGSFHPQGVW